MNVTQESASNSAWQQTSGEGGSQPPPQPGQPYPSPPPPQPVPQAAYRSQDPRRKSVPLAGILSAMPGLGQIYVGYYPRGFVHVLVAGSIIALMASDSLGDLTPLAGMFIAFFWLYNIIDAMRRADIYNKILEGGEEPELPDSFKMPAMGGSILGGLALIVGGGILLSHTRFDMSMDWVADWWPVVPILMGVYLVGKAIRERVAQESPERRSGDSGKVEAGRD